MRLMSQHSPLTIDELIRECGDLRWIYELRNHFRLLKRCAEALPELLGVSQVVASNRIPGQVDSSSAWRMIARVRPPQRAQ